MATMNVSLPDQMKAWVEAQVETGRYANSSDVIRDLIRRERDRIAAHDSFDRLIEEAYASGPAAPLDREQFLKELRASYTDA